MAASSYSGNQREALGCIIPGANLQLLMLNHTAPVVACDLCAVSGLAKPSLAIRSIFAQLAGEGKSFAPHGVLSTHRAEP